MRLINGLSTCFDLLIKGMAVMAGVLRAFSILSISIAIVA